MVHWRYTDIPLENPSFEGDYVARGANFVARGWQPWWRTGNPPREPGQGPCAAPEYKRLAAAEFPYRVMHGEYAQCWFLRWKVMDGGLLQYVPVPAGLDFMQFGVNAQAWCSQGEDPRRSEGEMYVAVGVDPFGRSVDPDELGILWSPWWPIGADYCRVDSPLVQAFSNVVTVYIRAWPKWKFSHNDVIVDGAQLQGITLECDESPGGGGGGEPAPVDYDEIEARMARQLTRLRLGMVDT